MKADKISENPYLIFWLLKCLESAIQDKYFKFHWVLKTMIIFSIKKAAIGHQNMPDHINLSQFFETKILNPIAGSQQCNLECLR